MLRGVDIDFAGRGARNRAEDAEVRGGGHSEARQEAAHEAEGRVAQHRRRRGAASEARREGRGEALLQRPEVPDHDHPRPCERARPAAQHLS